MLRISAFKYSEAIAGIYISDPSMPLSYVLLGFRTSEREFSYVISTQHRESTKMEYTARSRKLIVDLFLNELQGDLL